MGVSRSIFLYLDRTYVMQTAGVKSLWDLGLGLFRTHLERGAEVVRKAVTGLLRLLEKERHGESIDRTLTKSLLRMFSSLQVWLSTAWLAGLRNGVSWPHQGIVVRRVLRAHQLPHPDLCLSLSLSMQMYADNFEKPFLEQTAAFYQVCALPPTWPEP